MRVEQNAVTTTLQRSNSEIGSAPVISISAYAIQSLSRVASSQPPSSQIQCISRAVAGPMADPNR